MSIQSVCVYCGSSNQVSEELKSSAREIGAFIAQNKIGVVYGGGHVGLMGILADSALAEGGKVTGIIPHHLHNRERQHTGLTELHVVNDMHTRKRMMVEKSDAFIILPGGLGTLDETFEVMTWKQLGLHNKPIIVYNFQGFWTPLLGMIDHIISNGLAPESNRNLYQVASTPDELFKALHAPAPPPFDPATKWI